MKNLIKTFFVNTFLAYIVSCGEDKAKNTEEAEKTNIAEILIEKHRNGATGKVELFFNEKKANFLPLEKAQFSGAESEFREF